MSETLRPFHLAIPVDDLEAARSFYGGVLGCAEGRASKDWIDWNFDGHQLVTHKSVPVRSETNMVDGHDVPTLHFGLVMPWADWEALAAKLKDADADFLIEPGIRFAGHRAEQATLFVRDPAGNALEFKAFRDDKYLFAK